MLKDTKLKHRQTRQILSNQPSRMPDEFYICSHLLIRLDPFLSAKEKRGQIENNN